jgi:hypothetical protein
LYNASESIITDFVTITTAQKTLQQLRRRLTELNSETLKIQKQSYLLSLLFNHSVELKLVLLLEHFIKTKTSSNYLIINVRTIGAFFLVQLVHLITCLI